MRFADLHCHPTGKLFGLWSLENDAELLEENNHPWRLDLIKNKVKKIKKGKRATAYSQADFGKCIFGKTRISFASIYSFEQGFFQKFPPPESKFLKLMQSITFGHFLNTLIAHKFTNTSIPRVLYIKGDKYDYYKELKREYDFIKKMSGRDNIPEKAIVKFYNEKSNTIEVKKITGTYTILSDELEAHDELKFWKGKNISEFLDTKDERHKLVILTLEGINMLSMKNGFEKVDDKVLLDRVNDLKKWDPPIFFITLAHHFNNNICAHAHSIPKFPILRKMLEPDQKLNMNQMTDGRGISDLGLLVIRELLSIDKTGRHKGNQEGRRILIDVKHMSALARQEYYNKVIIPYNAGKSDDEKIPIIASHVGYSGISDLETLIKDAPNEKNKSAHKIFNSWNINLCNEDVKHIVNSRGIIGINFDQRILGHTSSNVLFSGRKKMSSMERIFKNILGMAADLPYQLRVYKADRFTFWNTICLGTDHDGLTDPLDDYPTMTEFPELREELIERLGRFEQAIEYGLYTSEDIEKVVDMICFDNAYRFLKTYF